MICQSCAELRSDTSGAACPVCGAALVAPTPLQLEALVRGKLRRRIKAWRDGGVIDAALAIRLEASLDARPRPGAVQPGSAAALEKRADEVAASLDRLTDWRPGWGAAFFQALEESAKEEREAARRRAEAGPQEEEDGDLGLALDSGGALFGQGGTGALGGLDAMVALDAAGGPRAREGALKLHEYVWWFLGALLVLGGSILGVREAWRALGGVPRQLIVTGSLFAYHAAFIGLGAFLARRSLSAGRVLAGIGLALLPVVFVALSALVSVSPAVGVVGALGVTGCCLITLRSAGRLLHGASGTSLAVALFPSLWAGLPLMGLGQDAEWSRGLCAFAGVGALGAALWRSRKAGEGFASLVSAGAALCGALALGVFCVASAPAGFAGLAPGGLLFAELALWVVALAALVAGAASGGAARESYPSAAPAVEVVSHALVAGAALGGALAAFAVAPGIGSWVERASVLTPVMAALAFFLIEPRRRALVHPGVVALTLAGVLLARARMPADMGWWCVGSAAVASGLVLLARPCESRALRIRLLAWGVVLSLASLLLVSLITRSWGQGSAWPAVATGVLVAVAAHLAAGHRWRALHYLGGIGVAVGALAALAEAPALTGAWPRLAALVLAGAIYGAAGLVHEAWARRTGNEPKQLLPLEDLSLAAASLGVLLSLGVVPLLPAALGASTGTLATALASAPTALAAVLLLARVRRDRSGLVAFLAASGGALVVAQLTGTVSNAGPVRAALVAAAVALGLAVLATLRGRGRLPVGAELPRHAERKLLGALPLPFVETGRPLFTDGFAAAAFPQVLLALLALARWLPVPANAERPSILLASALLIAGAVLAFFTRGFVAWRLRGSVLTLAAAGLLVTFTAVLNRAGRPLPPEVTAWRLPIIGVGVWLLALVARRYGPALGRRLENEPHGRLYHWVPHAGVAALGLVLISGAASVGKLDPSRSLGLVPPLTLLGAALLSLLLAASFRASKLVHLGLLLGLGGAAICAAQQALLGPTLAALVPPAAQWVRADALAAFPGLQWLQPEAALPPGVTLFVLWQRALAGVAAAGLGYAAAALVQARAGARLAFLRRLLTRVPEELRGALELSFDPFLALVLQSLRNWAVVAVALAFAAAFFQPGVPAAVLTFACGAVLLLGGARAQGRGALGVGVLLIIHAVAHQAPTVAGWPGPALAAVGLAVVALSPWMARLLRLDEGRLRVGMHRAAGFYALAGMVYALAAGGGTDPAMAVPQLLLEAAGRLDGRWMLSGALPLTVALVAATLLVGAFQWNGALAWLRAGWGSILAGVAAVAGLSVALVAQAQWARPGYGMLLSVFGATLALVAAGSAAVAHAAGRWLRTRRADVTGGLGVGRDAWLIGCGALLAIVAVLDQRTEGEVLPRAVGALGVAVAVALHCAWRQHTGRHVYFVQVAVVGVYALVRGLSATGLRPEHDALFALALGFVLVGVTVLSRRAGIPPVADATRRFAALLPVLMWLVLPGEATGQAALLAGGSGMLYAAIGAVERSRLFGSLAAAACNVALLIGALAFGLDGLEIYLAPLGLLMLMQAQLFSDSLPRAARNAVRVLGGMLLYVPAAARLSLQVGLAEDGTYALVFGGVCLLGVMVGMAMHIRAYLALGTLFLTLDVVANLVNAGLRDHRVGFVVMTLTGLSIVASRVLATLRGQQLELLLRRVRVELRGWD